MNNEETKVYSPEENSNNPMQTESATTSTKSNSSQPGGTPTPVPPVTNTFQSTVNSNNKGKNTGKTAAAVAGAAIAGTVAGAASTIGAAAWATNNLEDDGQDTDAAHDLDTTQDPDYVNDADINENDSHGTNPVHTTAHDADYTNNNGADPVIDPQDVPGENDVEILGVNDNVEMQDITSDDGEEIANIVEVDIDGDGVADGLATGDGEVVEAVYDLNGDGEIDAFQTIDAESDVVIADLDGDGEIDVLAIEDENGISVVSDTDGDGNPDTVEFTDGQDYGAMADTDGDGVIDAVAIDENQDGIIDENEVYTQDDGMMGSDYEDDAIADDQFIEGDDEIVDDSYDPSLDYENDYLLADGSEDMYDDVDMGFDEADGFDI